MYHRLTHINPKMNDTSRWWRVVGDTPYFHLAVIYGEAGCLNSTVHAVLKKDYTMTQEADPTPTVDVRTADADDLI